MTDKIWIFGAETVVWGYKAIPIDVYVEKGVVAGFASTPGMLIASKEARAVVAYC